MINFASPLLYLIDPRVFYFRHWEYFDDVVAKTEAYGLTKTALETGDLSRNHYFYYQDGNATTVTVDQWGNRITPAKSGDIKILFLGESTIFGSFLSDEETLPWVISELLDVRVFNAARVPGISALHFEDVNENTLIVDGRTERILGTRRPLVASASVPRSSRPLNRFEVLASIPLQRYRLWDILDRTAGRLRNDYALMRTSGPSKLLYYVHSMDRESLNGAIDDISAWAEYFRGKGYRYLFLPVPAKQTIYKRDLPPFTRNFIRTLVTELRQKSIHAVNVVPYMERAAKDRLVFHRYDTHWNDAGVAAVARGLADYIEEHALMEPVH